ncbi:MAG: hypothetical protein LUH04_11305 [Clostridium sp.]|nr:hypothetical protein [Clostridium sp.]
MKKLKSRSGETLAEVLVAILVVAVSTSLFFGHGGGCSPYQPAGNGDGHPVL